MSDDPTNQTTKTRHPCAGRSKRVVETFEAIAVGQRLPYSRAAIKALLDAGLIEQIGDETVGCDGFGLIKVPVFEVPLPIHYQWCRWCAENVPDEALQ